jgi:hypothetical protein
MLLAIRLQKTWLRRLAAPEIAGKHSHETAWREDTIGS